MEKEYEKKENEKVVLKKYEKPKVTVVKLQIEERLMACDKAPGPGCRKGNKNS